MAESGTPVGAHDYYAMELDVPREKAKAIIEVTVIICQSWEYQ